MSSPTLRRSPRRCSWLRLALAQVERINMRESRPDGYANVRLQWEVFNEVVGKKEPQLARRIFRMRSCILTLVPSVALFGSKFCIFMIVPLLLVTQRKLNSLTLSKCCCLKATVLRLLLLPRPQDGRALDQQRHHDSTPSKRVWSCAWARTSCIHIST